MSPPNLMMKSAFFNRFINEEVYVSQPPDFEDHKHPDHEYKIKKKALYGLKQAPRYSYEMLRIFSCLMAMREEKLIRLFLLKSINLPSS